MNREAQKEALFLEHHASGRPGKFCSEDEFAELALTKGNRISPNTSIKFDLGNGNIYEADSEQEKLVWKRLKKMRAFERSIGQCAPIQYMYHGKKRTYTPDFVFLTLRHRIVFVEVKELIHMALPQSRAKYKALGRFCRQCGYLYMMCDQKLRTYESLRELSPMKKVCDAIDKAILAKGYFGYDDYRELRKGKKKPTLDRLRDSIGIYLFQNRTLTVRGDFAKDIRNLRVYPKRSHPRTRK